MNEISPDETVAAIAARSPELAAILHRRGLDLCCGGAHPLRLAAQAHGIDLAPLLAELNASRH